MRNFGRFILPAELITYRSQNKPESVTDAQLQEAIEKLSVIINCANAVLENPTGDLVSADVHDLPADDKANYLDSYTFFMDEFKLSIIDYQSAFIKILAQPQAERDYSKLMQLTKDQDALIDRAHRKLKDLL